MLEYYRMIDANINRAAEGIRVCEDYARFVKNDQELSRMCKLLRHKIRSLPTDVLEKCLLGRDSLHDVGCEISKATKTDDRKNTSEFVAANCKRAQEALRTVEETLKILGYYEVAKTYEEFRFSCYSLEKELFSKREHCIEIIKQADIYGITAEELSNGRGNIEVVGHMLNAGVRVIQYREKEKPMLEKYRECMEIHRMTQKCGAVFIVDDDVDLALCCAADGVHIGQDDLPIEAVRKIAGDMVVGLSTHNPEQAQDAVLRGADYIGVGPIFATHTKKNVCAPVGLSYLEYVIKNIALPYVAIGGIKEHNIDSVLACGAQCVCLVSEITGAGDIEETIKRLKDKIKGGIK